MVQKVWQFCQGCAGANSAQIQTWQTFSLCHPRRPLTVMSACRPASPSSLSR